MIVAMVRMLALRLRRSFPMSFLDKILSSLDDAKVHNVSEVKRITRLKEEKVREAIKFMAEFHFVMFDEPTGSVAAVEPIQKLISVKEKWLSKD